MSSTQKCCVLFLAAIIVAAALRMPCLKIRPMHTDEAVHAIKFQQLLEEGSYKYDPLQYHGPTLNYLTLIPAWLCSSDKLTEVSEITLRIVPVFFGILLVGLVFLLTDGLTRPIAIVAAFLTAVSPAMVYYSRYYIQEMLLVCFTFGLIVFGYRYLKNGKLIWALSAGLCLGLMHATKETCVISIGSMLLALIIVCLSQRGHLQNKKKILRPTHIAAGLGAAVFISILFYSYFFTNPQAISDSLLTYTNYINRAGNHQWHIHPWYYYLRMLIYTQYSSGPVWTEGIILLLAAFGLTSIITKKNISGIDVGLVRFLAFYTVIMTVIYSAIPYKTPWCALGFLHGMILLASIGTIVLVRLAPPISLHVIIFLVLIIAGAHLTWQAYLGSYKYYADPANPYVYAHTSNDIYKIVNHIEELAKAHPKRKDMYMQVICPGGDYWPLPWYLRTFSKVHYQTKVQPNGAIAPLIIASPAVESELIKKLYELPPPGQKELYVPLFDTYTELRPQVELRGYVTKQLWDSSQQLQKECP